MGISYRYYLFPQDGPPKRLSKRLIEGLVHGRDSIPEYAGTRQKVATVVLSLEGGKPREILETRGAFWDFDKDGDIGEGLRNSMGDLWKSIRWPIPEGKVVDLGSRLAKKKYAEVHEWQPTPAEVDILAADLWPNGKATPLKPAKGRKPRKPPLTFDGERAIEKISRTFWEFSFEIDNLKDPSLKGFAAEARERAEDDHDYEYLYRAIAQMAELQFEIRRRRRSEKGIWYALVEGTSWRDNTGKNVFRVHERCEGREAAVLAARKLLAEHAGKFDANVTVEAELMPEIEWDRRPFK